jgi:hypothetical protein
MFDVRMFSGFGSFFFNFIVKLCMYLGGGSVDR